MVYYQKDKGESMTTIDMYDEANAQKERYNPIYWSSKDGSYVGSVLIDPYWLDKAQEKHISNDDLLGFAYENGAKTVMRTTTPKGNKEIAFVFLNFADVYREPDKAIEIFKRAFGNLVKEQTGNEVKLHESKNTKLLRLLGKKIKEKA